MKPHRILKTFKGSQTGHDHHAFVEGTTRDLSDSLAAIVVKEGWAEPSDEVHQAAKPRKSAIPALERETKVVGPEETKVVEPESTKSLDDMDFGELKVVAKAKGVKVFGLSEVKLRDALKA